MEFRTNLKNIEKRTIIKSGSKVLLLGSCFAEHLFAFLQNLKQHTFLNPCGITYNPVSLTNAIYYLTEYTTWDPSDIQESGGRYFHFDFHGSFSATSKVGMEDNINRSIENGKNFLPPDVLIVSLGTALVYEWIQNSQIVNNCHKIPTHEFKKYRLTTNEVVEVLKSGISILRNISPTIKVILTVSPVRHIREGIIENNRSKATLLLAAGILEQEVENLIYFPSYELLLDDLRDYRFYGEDLVHPNNSAIQYILEFFEDHFMDPSEKTLRKHIKSITKRLNHRPFLPASRQHQDFLIQLQKDMVNLETQYGIDFSKEKVLVQKQII